MISKLEFIRLIALEFKIFSGASYELSNRKHKKFYKWVIKKNRKHKLLNNTELQIINKKYVKKDNK